VKQLKDILRAIETKEVVGSVDVSVLSIETDSRKVVAGTVFVAIEGTVVDGHSFVDKAIEMGAIAIVCTR